MRKADKSIQPKEIFNFLPLLTFTLTVPLFYLNVDRVVKIKLCNIIAYVKS